ncbi:MAG: ribonuclease P protein component [Hyphomicrobiaceae bacterium]
METLKRRAEFLAVRGGVRWSTPAFLMEGRRRPRCADCPQPTGPRFGFTVTRKLGGAVVRNRMRRRLREAIRVAGEERAAGDPGWDYVVVARHAALTLPFDDLIGHVREALARIGKGGGNKPGARQGGRGR